MANVLTPLPSKYETWLQSRYAPGLLYLTASQDPVVAAALAAPLQDDVEKPERQADFAAAGAWR